MTTPLDVRAYAKLNLGLRVLGRRSDGFHEVHTHMQMIDLFDELEIDLARGGIELVCDPGLGLAAEDNLVHRAIRLFQQKTGFSTGVHCRLKKSIPMGAGLGGGSSDAAAVLLALNNLYDTNLDLATLAQWAAELGSDVPVFLHGGLACAQGRGERVRPLPGPASKVQFVVIVPPFPAVTPEVYAAWDELHPNGVVEDVACEDLSAHNDLELAACRRYPALKRYAEAIARAPTPLKGMSGSGSAWYAGFNTQADALAYREQLVQDGNAGETYCVKAV